MVKKETIQADYISIALSKHHRTDLIDLHNELIPNKAKNEKKDYFKQLSKMDIVMEIAKTDKVKKIESLWSDKLFASNQSVSYHAFYEANSNKKNLIKNGIKLIKNKISAFDELLEKTHRPNLTEEPKLIKINRNGSKYVFMFGALGRKKYVPIEYKYEVYQEPKFAYCVWDNKESILQIRTPGNTADYLIKFQDWLTNSPAPDIQGLRITKDSFDAFVTEIQGTVRTAKGKASDIANQYEAKELTSKKDLDVRQTTNYGKEMGDFEVYSHGVDFEHCGDEYRLYIGFKSGTIFFKKGSINEQLLDHIKNAVAEVQ